jgi:hypothetical protein
MTLVCMESVRVTYTLGGAQRGDPSSPGLTRLRWHFAGPLHGKGGLGGDDVR